MPEPAPREAPLSTQDRTLLEIVRHILTRRPNLAPHILNMAAAAQGKHTEMVLFREWLMSSGKSNAEVFNNIYAQRHWGASSDPARPYYSGSGSRTAGIVDVYVKALERFTASLPSKPSGVDLGCGDFSVGERVRPLFSSYIACDVVPALVAHNREAFAHLDVDFRSLDICRDPLPSAEVAMVRQVLQHLSNADILRFVEKARTTYRYLICTEHVPLAANFTPNKDKPTGPGNRLVIGSGVDLARAPFNLGAIDECVLCTAEEEGAVIVTRLYQLGA